MLENIDIKLIALVGIILLIGVGYLVYSLYKDLVFLKTQINSGNPVLEFEESEEDFNQEDDTEEDEELERHLQNIMEEARHYEHHHDAITEVEEDPIIQFIQPEPEIQMVELPVEPEVKKRKSKKKVTINEPSLNLDESIALED